MKLQDELVTLFVAKKVLNITELAWTGKNNNFSFTCKQHSVSEPLSLWGKSGNVVASQKKYPTLCSIFSY